MPIKLSELTNATKSLEVDLGEGEVINLTIRSNFYTPKLEAESKNIEASDIATGTAAILAEAITGWDITDDRGKTLPVTREHIDQLGIVVLDKIFKTILREIFPNEQKGKS